MINFACISPHPPIILPSVGSDKDRTRVQKTIKALENLGEKLKESAPNSIIISSPHPDWGIKVPLHFLNSKIMLRSNSPEGQNQNVKLQFKIQNYQSTDNAIIELSDTFNIYPILTTFDSPKQHFEWGKNFYLKIENWKLKIALIASGDLSHCLKADGPYGFNPDGPKFDKDLIDALKEKDIKKILKLDELYPEAGECGLRSFCFLLGILEASGINYQPEILSYEGPFGVGYLVINFKL
jgi:aromatic ring-opening dioxygenase LigB subunit